MNLVERWREILESLREEGRYRRLSLPCGIDFSSNDYLGLGKEPPPAVVDLPKSGLASRLLCGHHQVWDEVEHDLARWHGAEAALIFTSGYVANEGLLETIIEPDDYVASDELNHASIIDGVRLSRAERFRFRHNDLNHLETGLSSVRKRSSNRQMFVITESLFGMDGDRAPLAELVDLAERYQAHLIVDEAHATGCFGPKGSGLVDAAGLRHRVLATVHTGGKALGAVGAYVCGSAQLKELLINRCRHFIFTTALPPALGLWWLDALKRVQAADDRRQKLHEAAQQFRNALPPLSGPKTETRKPKSKMTTNGMDYIVPLIVGDDVLAVRWAEHLQAKGFDIRAIRPPSVPPGTARLRVSIHADHTPDELSAAARAVAELHLLAAGVP
jgi:8-amino-7-oxononanoate synthase